jgi:hypothetical protein
VLTLCIAATYAACNHSHWPLGTINGGTLEFNNKLQKACKPFLYQVGGVAYFCPLKMHESAYLLHPVSDHVENKQGQSKLLLLTLHPNGFRLA